MCCNGIFCRGLYGVLGLSRVIFRMSGNVFTPYTEGIYVFYGVKGVVKMVIFGVNDWSFLTALDTFGKKRRIASLSGLLMARASSRPTQTRAYSPQRPVAFAFGELLPQPLASVTSESDWSLRRARGTKWLKPGASPKDWRRRRACVGRELARAISKPERLAILRSFRVRTEANRIPFLTKAKTKANYLCKPRLRALQPDSIWCKTHSTKSRFTFHQRN